ncbi:MFS transporter [Virgisporangium aurantiacum]|uniref:MFS transporter n=1 Tax=Virgisporangium aurantiacum TaxID=175570 RepID=A0A8J3ZDC5_9ACTN|nr:MFS transporter [Virgisporangium aurantiacum]GIJ61861.1 MFS transporter [Virgisporangium aurantiacum]
MSDARTRSLLLVGPFMAQADVTIANVATPSIHEDLGASGALLELVVGGYLIAFAVLLITGARLGQIHGYGRMFLLGVGLFTVASLLCGLAPTPTALVAARILQGFGAALMFPQTLTGIQVTLDGRERVRAIGRYAIALSSGAVAGQLLGGLLVSADIAGTQWRAVFLVNVPVGLLVIVAGLRYLPVDAHRVARRLDLPGVAVLSVALGLLVVPLVVGRDVGWPAWTWVCLALAGPAFAGFVVVQRRIAARGGEPLVAVGVLGRPAVSAALVTLMVATGTYYALLFTVAQYLQHGRGYSPAVSGLTLVPWVAAFGLAGQLVRRLPVDAVRRAPAAGCVLLGVTYLAIAGVTVSGHRSLPPLVVLFAVGGLGLGVQFSALIAHLTAAVPPRHAAEISGVSGTVMLIGGAVSIATFGTLYLALASHPTTAFGVTTVGLAAAALTAGAAAYRATRTSGEVIAARRRPVAA